MVNDVLSISDIYFDIKLKKDNHASITLLAVVITNRVEFILLTILTVL